MIKKEEYRKVIEINKVQTDDSVKHADGVSIILTREQLEFFKLCREFNNKFYKGSIKTVAVPYESGDVKYIGGIKEHHAHGKGKLYYRENVPYKEGYFMYGMYLGPEETKCTHIFMEDIIEDICHYVPSMDRSILRKASESIQTVHDVEDYLNKNDISNQVEKIIHRTIVVE